MTTIDNRLLIKKKRKKEKVVDSTSGQESCTSHVFGA